MKWCLVVIGLLMSTLNSANEIEKMIELLNNKQSTANSLKQAITLGKERAILCGYCHGKDGNSVKEYIPNLAGQHPEYLVTQFEAFSQGSRYNYVMAKLAKNLSIEERVNLALYYASLQVKPSKVSTDNVQKQAGKVLFSSRCVMCHGSEGLGKHSLPRLAGQPEQYIINTLNIFRQGHRKLPGSPMQGIAAGLTKPDIAAVAAYITSM
ncbi:cytochrome c4 [Endozoicomonas sp. SM1973]|uniref:Cytochrome c4 n=1 Tax=Spartinivicinus marinus TaxID=2994442 RepID=A0A853IER7_9GAMM|nr:c-type cytochrome [Spartinivicinus marinus]MCX4026052.1 c-type cytochrome [Spartinivicinus marinus]NYZ69028.1 cytochrome c4 [Spartinivicinus marinus]